MPGAVGRREGAAGDGEDALRPAELPGAGRADQPSRYGDQGDADHGAVGVRGHHAVRLTRPALPRRAVQSGAGADAGGHSPVRRRLHGIRGAHRPRGARPAQLRRKARWRYAESVGGEGGIRTHGTVARTPHFECGTIDHSATSPEPTRRRTARSIYRNRAPQTRAARQHLRRRKASFPAIAAGSAYCDPASPALRITGPSAPSRTSRRRRVPCSEPLPIGTHAELENGFSDLRRFGRAALISVLSFSRIGRGVSPGATIICHAVVSKPGTPTLASGGISGAAADRLGAGDAERARLAGPDQLDRRPDDRRTARRSGRRPESVIAGTLPL